MKALLNAMTVVGLVSSCLAGESVASDPQVIWLRPDDSLQWKTVMRSNPNVTLCWPAGAVTAELVVDSGKGSVVTQIVSDITADAVNLPVSIPASLQGESVLSLEVVYKDRSDGILKTERAQVGLVSGVAGCPTRCLTSAASRFWCRASGSSVVIPLSADVSELSVDDVPVVSYDAPGWWLLSGLVPGKVTHLTMTDGAAESAADIVFKDFGLMLIVR